MWLEKWRKKFCKFSPENFYQANFCANMQKSENFDFDWILLPKAKKDLDEKIQKSCFMTLKSVQSLKKN